MHLLLGLAAAGRGDLEAAADAYDRALMLARQLDPDEPLIDHLMAMVLNNRAVAAVQLDSHDSASTDAQEALAIWTARGDQWGMSVSTDALAFIALHRGKFEQAGELYQQNLMRFYGFGDVDGVANCMTGIGAIMCKLGRPTVAARLLGAADATRTEINAPVPRMIRKEYDRTLETARAELGDQRSSHAWQSGFDLDLHQVIAEVMQLHFRKSPGKDVPFGLTPRQLEVLRLIAEGHTDQEIANVLFIQYRTVTSHVQDILSKMGRESRTAASIEAVRMGLI